MFQYIQDILAAPDLAQPQCVDLLEVLDGVFAEDAEQFNLLPLQTLLVALIEDGQRHTSHGEAAPNLGWDACARRGSANHGRNYIYCRYLFPRLLRLLDELRKGEVLDDPHRPGLRNLFLARNDSLINPFEGHIFLCNVGNVDWRALLDLWAVLEYLTKYAAKAGKGSASIASMFQSAVQVVDNYEKEDGLHDLWRRAIMKFYSKAIGCRDYTLLETVHYGLRLPAILTSFGSVRQVGVSDWACVKSHAALQSLDAGGRASTYNKLELFDSRGDLRRPRGLQVAQ